MSGPPDVPLRDGALTLAEVRLAGGYGVVYADVPWKYGNRGVNGAAEKHYRTMSVAEVSALPVARVAADDAALFLWVPSPFLARGEHLPVVGCWGFEPKTVAFCWVKQTSTGREHVGTGFYTRANVELCVLATRGRVRRLDAAVRQLLDEGPDEVRAARGRHSAKPAEVRRRIERLLGDVPRVELFARERADGWDAWGDEVPGGSDVELVDRREVGFLIRGALDGSGPVLD